LYENARLIANLVNTEWETIEIVDKKQERLHLLEGQIRRVQKRIDILDPLSNRYSWIRVFIFFGGLGLSLIVLIFSSWRFALPLAILTLLAFAIVAHFHSRIDRSVARHTLWRYIKAAHIARIKLNWEDIPVAYSEPLLADHPFAYDIDIAGKHSLHRLLNTAVSREGSQRLCDWLLNTNPDLATIQSRQELVRELVPLTRFRDKLILHSLFSSRRVSEELEGQRLVNWLQKHTSSPLIPLLFWAALALNVLTILAFVLALFLPIPNFWGAGLVISMIFFFATANLRGDLFEDSSYLRYGFTTLSSIFSYLEIYRYGKHLHLKALCEPFFRDREQGPTRLLKKTARIASAATLRRNPFLWLPLNVLIPWDAYCAYRLSQYKKEVAERLPVWLDTWFELEALCSLAAFAYLNPEYTMPNVFSPAQLQEGESKTPLFEGKSLGHPLLLAEKKVTNDFTIDKLGDVIILTGSNMAGKSTFLRTLGVNLCLAYAGGPTNAQTLHVSLFRLFSCIRVSDSVTDGYSYFFAEVRRLRALLDELERPNDAPLFFLVDEIFKGTNNRERLIGSRSYVRAVVGRNCVGAISTHDLELVKLEETIPQVLNYHFREEVKDGNLVFDYILRTGPCPTTNALKLMALEGLPIDG
jgi:hypothetical protein